MKMRKVAGRRGGDRRRTLDLGVEHCESRMLLTTFTVVNTANNTATSGSLAWAIDQANLADISNPGQLNTIDFNIPGTGPFTIDIGTGALPTIQDPVIIDGTSESGYVVGTPMIEIDGFSQNVDGLVLTGDAIGSTIEGLAITDLVGAAIHVETADNLIVTDELGFDPSNSSDDSEGVWIAGASGNTIGGTNAAAANVIGNAVHGSAAGVFITGTANSNLVEGNFIGTDAAGDNLGDTYGVDLTGGQGNVIGGTVSGAANVIERNSTVGVEISTAAHTTVEGNTIGTAAYNGNGVGVELDAATDNTIGGTVSGAGNTIAFNTTALVINSGSGNGYRENLIYGNGSSFSSGSPPSLPATPTIVAATSVASLTTIDYTVTGSVGETYAIDFFASDISGGPAADFLGTVTTPALTSATQSFTASFNPGIPPLRSGQAVTATVTDANNNTSIFATAVAPVAPFVVTNTNDDVPGGAVGSLPQAILDANQTPGSTITFDIPGTAPFVIGIITALPSIIVNTTIDGYTQPGFVGTPIVELDGGDQPIYGLTLGAGANSSTIEGLDIVGFGDAGIDVEGSADLIAGNYLGPGPSGTSAGPGNVVGVLVGGAGNTIGGTTAAAANVIGFNTAAPGAGVYLTANGNLVEGNLIGTDAVGDNLGNATGIEISVGTGNTIGGTNAAAANVIGFSGTTAIQVLQGTSNLIEGNFIGTDAAGAHLGNAMGVQLVSNSASTTIGGTAAGAGNTIAYNTGPAVDVDSGLGNAIRGNLIYANAQAIVLGTGANNNQAAPSNLAVSSVIGTTTIDYTVTGTVGQADTIDFYASTALGGPAGAYLGTVTTPALTSATESFAATLSLASPLTSDQTLTATATDPTGDTSPFGAAVVPDPPFLVINTNDGGVGSLRQAILDANLAAPSVGQTDHITFDIPGTGPFVISPASALPEIAVPVTIDGTGEPGFYPNDQPLIEINGQGQNADGLVLFTGSNGSTIQGLDIVDFGFAGIHLESSGDTVLGCDLGTDPTGTFAGPGDGEGLFIDQSSNDTIGGAFAAAGNTIGFNTAVGVSITGSANNAILGNFIGTDPAGASAANGAGILINGISSGNSIGGTAAGEGNTIADNGGDAIEIVNDAGDLIRRNLIHGNASDIVETVPASTVPAPPTGLAVASVPGLTTIDYRVTGTVGQAYTLDFFATDISGGPAAVFLGSVTTTALESATQGFTATFNLAHPLLSGQLVTATVTGPGGATSTFAATVVKPVAPFLVTNTNDDTPGQAVGSLRQAILDADDSLPPTGATDDITFDIPGTGPFLIALTLDPSLPEITVPVTIDGTTEPGYNGTPLVGIQGAASPTLDGLLLGSGAVGSTIEGLDITDFAGAAIHLQSSGDRVVADDLGTGPAGSLASPGDQFGVWIDSAANETIGGTTAASANLIGFNQIAGVSISGAAAQGNVVAGNFIGTDAAGDDLANAAAVAINGSSNNTIGGTVTGASGVPASGNTIGWSTSGGVEILSGSGDAVRENTYTAANGSATQPSLAASDVVPSAGADDNQPAPALVSAAVVGDQLILSFTDAVTSGTAVTLDIYEYLAGGVASLDGRIFLGTATATVGGTTASVAIAAPAITTATRLVATATVAQNTSAFSAPIAVTAPIVVTNTGDNSQSPAAHSLRWAILQAEATSGATIVFDIANSDPGFHNGSYIITLTSALPAITVPVTIEGGSQPGFNASFPVPIVEINAGGTAAGSDGLLLGPGSGGSTIQGLDIVRASGAGLHIKSASNLIVGDVFGVDISGTLPGAGNGTGILIDNAAANTIGGTTATAAVVVDSSTGAGVSITGASAQGNLVEGDLIGIAFASTSMTLGNGLGIVISGGSNNTIGGTVAGAGNTIAFNGGAAVTVQTGVLNTIRENLIYADGSGASTGIVLANGGNDNTPAPVIASVEYLHGSVEVTLETAMAAGTILDFFASLTPVAPNGPVVAQVFVGSTPASQAGQTTFTLPAASLASNQDLIATATSAAGDSSAFSDTASVSNPLSVTSTADAGTGSLRAAIAFAETDPSPAADVITFNIAGTGPFVIDLTTPMTIGHAVILDAATQPGYLNTPIVELDGDGAGNGPVAEGLILEAPVGSAIEGLNLDGFAGAGVDIRSDGNLLLDDEIQGNGVGLQISGSDNTIGGTSTGNLITANAGDAVYLISGTGNAIRGNLIFGNGSANPAEAGIVLGPNETGIPAPPTLTSAISDSGQTTVAGSVSGYAPDSTFIVDFYSYAPGQDPAQNDLGSATVETDSDGNGSFSQTVTGFSSGGLSITATSTGPESANSSGGAGNTTSTFSSPVRVRVTSAFVVNNLSDDPSVAGSLPYVIGEVDRAPSASRSAPDVITFNITTGDAPFVIDVTSSLPMITVPVTIDGTSQIEYDGLPVVELQGSGAALDGLVFAAGSDGSTVEGLDIVGFGGPSTTNAGVHIQSSDVRIYGNAFTDDQVGVLIDDSAASTVGGYAGYSNTIGGEISAGVSIAGSSATGNVVSENDIGTDGTGSMNLGSGEGIVIDGGASGNTIGGSSATAANVIEFNGTGVAISGPMTSDNVVAANFIGTDSASLATAGNVVGIGIADGASRNLIGGVGSGNTIGGNTAAGVSISGASSVAATADNVVSGNSIGVDAGGDDLGNGEGVAIVDAFSNTIGGTASGAGNTIADNAGDGVQVASGSGNSIRENSIYGNAAASIDVAGGANSGQQMPSNLAVSSVPFLTTIDFQVTTSAAGPGTYAVDFFASSAIGGPASVFLGTSSVYLATSGSRSFTTTLSLPTALAGGQQVTATVTGPDGSTSPLASSIHLTPQFEVTNASDNQPGSEVGSLRQVIINANASPSAVGTDRITFEIAGATLIHLDVALPTIAVPLTIDGTTQAGVGIDGGGGTFDGLVLGTGIDPFSGLPSSSAGSTIEGLDIQGFDGNGILVSSGDDVIGGPAAADRDVILANQHDGVLIESSDNLVEQDVVEGSGVVGSPIQYDGIDIQGAGNTIDGNVISGNAGDGILIESSASSTLVEGNHIGTSPAGDVALANGADGIGIQGSSNTIGGTSSTAANTISGNANDGLLIAGVDAFDNQVEGNFIGTNGQGTGGVANQDDGVEVQTPSNTIGGTAGGALNTMGASTGGSRNIISGNAKAGVMIETTGITVENNAIGTNLGGTGSLLTQQNGVVISGPSNSMQGTSASGGVLIQANLISGNLDSGIYLEENASGEQVEGNFIGTDATGTKSVPNANGIVVTGLGGNRIGDALPNLISGNSGSGISLSGELAGNTVLGNLIGTDVSGGHAVGNDVGITIASGSNNTIGGAAPGNGNIISGNGSIGIQISNSTSTGNVVRGNKIGTDAAVTTALTSPDPTTGLPIGILIDDSPANTIGGTSLLAANVIAGFGVGIDISGFDAHSNLMVNNRIGADLDGHPIAGSIGIGVYIDDVASNTVGASTPGIGNVIAGYNTYGVFIYGALAAHNVVEGNRIGVPGGKTGELAGIAIEDSSDNTLGGPTSSAGNTISGNSYAGIYIFGQGSTGASDNVIEHDRFQRNGYGILLFNAANNGGYQTLLSRNRYTRNGIANVREFQGTVTGGTASSHLARSKKSHKLSHHAAIHRTRLHDLRSRLVSQRSEAVTADRAGGRLEVGERGPLRGVEPARELVRVRVRPGVHPAAVPRGPLAHAGRAIRKPVA
jgi:parallel beta-helix repeat protein